MMDVEKEAFDMVYLAEFCIFSMSLSPHDTKSLCFSEGRGLFNKWDLRAGKSSLTCDLHEERINTIDFNSENENIIATSSTDGRACIWDLRLMNKKNLTPLKTVNHEKAVHAAYFSPSGKFLATTRWVFDYSFILGNFSAILLIHIICCSLDDNVGLSSGENYEKTSMVYHYNQTGRWLSKFRYGISLY